MNHDLPTTVAKVFEFLEIRMRVDFLHANTSVHTSFGLVNLN